MKSTYLDTPEAQLYYEVVGHGTPILMLHGNSQSHHVFHSYKRNLQKSYQVIVAFRAKCKMFSRHLQKPILKTEKGRFKGL